jgi:hypothetical protein
VELAATRAAAQPGGLTVAGITAVFTIDYVAEMLGEDVEWLHELSQELDPEDGCLWVYGVGEDGVIGFTKFGIESLRELIADLRATGRAQPLIKPAE